MLDQEKKIIVENFLSGPKHFIKTGTIITYIIDENVIQLIYLCLKRNRHQLRIYHSNWKFQKKNSHASNNQLIINRIFS